MKKTKSTNFLRNRQDKKGSFKKAAVRLCGAIFLLMIWLATVERTHAQIQVGQTITGAAADDRFGTYISLSDDG